jgi:RNA-directed DNA polymerase
MKEKGGNEMILTEEEWESAIKICKDRKAHYNRYLIPKKSGKKREILAPSDELKALQNTILKKYLYAYFIPSVYATGFVVDRSIVHNATAHVGASILVNIDLKDFFPTIKDTMLKEKVFKKKLIDVHKRKINIDILKEGKLKDWQIMEEHITARMPSDTYFEEYATLLTKLVTYPYEDKDALPQGAPTSPALSNIVCFEMDNVLSGFAARNDAVYTRYADDLTFSSASNVKLNRCIRPAKKILESYGFTANERKIHVNRRSGRMQVTGLVVNDKVSYGRGRWRIIRASLHNTKMKVCKDKEIVPFDEMHYRGMAAFLYSFDRQKASCIHKEVDQIVNGIKELKR